MVTSTTTYYILLDHQFLIISHKIKHQAQIQYKISCHLEEINIVVVSNSFISLSKLIILRISIYKLMASLLKSQRIIMQLMRKLKIWSVSWRRKIGLICNCKEKLMSQRTNYTKLENWQSINQTRINRNIDQWRTDLKAKTRRICSFETNFKTCKTKFAI